MTTKPEELKVTYTSSNVDLERFHALFDQALEAVRGDLGRTWPLYIGGEEVLSDADPITDCSPIDTRVVLGRFQAARPHHVDQAVKAAKAAAKVWGRTPWPERVRILRNAASLLRERKFEFGALMALEVGKNRLESMGDVEEAADLIDYYCQQMEDASGFVRKMKRLTPSEDNTDVLRPYGVFVCIAPFNFPAALAAGMSSAALVAGNSLVFKPATCTPLTGLRLFETYRDAGLPPGVINFVTGRGGDVGDTLTMHPLVDGVVFTGSKAVGMHIFHNLSRSWPKPCLLEMGGKNPAIVMPSAELDAAAEGVYRSAWGLQGQKCSACSRVYVHRDVADAFLERLVERTRNMVIGDPTRRETFLGPVINPAAWRTFERAVAQAREEGEVVLGGERMTEGELVHGHFVQPTIVKAPLDSTLFREELFVPFLAVGVVDSLDQAIEESNAAEYGLTAGIFSKDPAEVDRFFDDIESGVTYANKHTGATTGAWPGAQPFCGWKGSGATGKGGCGPYYVSQFMREQSRTVITP